VGGQLDYGIAVVPHAIGAPPKGVAPGLVDAPEGSWEMFFISLREGLFDGTTGCLGR